MIDSMWLTEADSLWFIDFFPITITIISGLSTMNDVKYVIHSSLIKIEGFQNDRVDSVIFPLHYQ